MPSMLQECVVFAPTSLFYAFQLESFQIQRMHRYVQRLRS